MAKSRIKSDAEYNEILGVEAKGDIEVKTTHDVNQYFNELKETKNDNHSEDNPFEKIVSIQEIKKSLTQDQGKNNVENIKQQIASAQTETVDNLDEIDDIVVVPRNTDSSKKEFSFEENAKKLYENLRGGNKVAAATKAKPEETKTKDIETNKIDIIDPISISEQRVAKQDEVLSEASLSDEFNRFELDEQMESDSLDLTADFTKENENFIDAINKQKSQLENHDPIKPQKEDIEVSKMVESKLENDNDDIVSQLDKQLDVLNGTAELKLDKPLDKSTNIEEISLHELDILSSKENKPEFKNTLKLALDPEDTASFTAKELDILQSDEIETDLKSNKRKTLDKVVTFILIVMIILAAVSIYFAIK